MENKMFVNKIIFVLILLYFIRCYIYILYVISVLFLLLLYTRVMTPTWWHLDDDTHLADDSLPGDDDNTRVAEVGLKRFELGASLWAAEDRRKRQKTAGAGHEFVSI